MREYRERDLLGADIPDNPLGGVVVGLVMAVLGGGLMVAVQLGVAAAWSGGYLSIMGLGGVCFGLAQALYALSRLRPYLRYQQTYEPEVSQWERHKKVAMVAGVLVALLIGEFVFWLVL